MTVKLNHRAETLSDVLGLEHNRFNQIAEAFNKTHNDRKSKDMEQVIKECKITRINEFMALAYIQGMQCGIDKAMRPVIGLIKDIAERHTTQTTGQLPEDRIYSTLRA